MTAGSSSIVRRAAETDLGQPGGVMHSPPRCGKHAPVATHAKGAGLRERCRNAAWAINSLEAYETDHFTMEMTEGELEQALAVVATR